MELEKLVKTELVSMDLPDIKIIDLSCELEATAISCLKDDQIINFTIQNDGTLQVTELVKGDLVYTDEESLSQSNEWFEAVVYVRDVVKPIIEKYQLELSEATGTISKECREGCECKEGLQSQYEELLKMMEEMKGEIAELKRLEKTRGLPQKPPATRKEKVLYIVGNIAFYFTLITVVLGVALFGLQEPGAPPRSLFGHSMMTVLSGSMEPAIALNSLVIMREVDANTLEVGDVVTYLTPNNRTITHRITEILENYQGRGMRGFRLQGDNNLLEDGDVIWADNVIGEIIYTNQFLGQVISFIQEYIVLIVIFIVLFAALVFVIKKFFLEPAKQIPSEADLGEGMPLSELVESDLELVESPKEEGEKKQLVSKDHLMLVIIVVIAAVFSYSVFRILMIGQTYRNIEAASGDLRDNYTQILMTFAEVEDEDDVRELLTIDWIGLHDRNEDVVAWVYVPGTNINYPILAGETNEEYLSLDLDLQHSIAGSIFLEENNTPTFLDLNTIVYGHNMANGSKFSDIDRFVSGEINVENAAYVYLYLPNGTVNIYQIVGAQLTDIYSEIYHLPVVDLAGFYDLILEGNMLNVSFDKEVQPRVLTLSTCAELGVNSPLRSVVFAVLIEEVNYGSILAD